MILAGLGNSALQPPLAPLLSAAYRMAKAGTQKAEVRKASIEADLVANLELPLVA